MTHPSTAVPVDQPQLLLLRSTQPAALSSTSPPRPRPVPSDHVTVAYQPRRALFSVHARCPLLPSRDHPVDRDLAPRQPLSTATPSQALANQGPLPPAHRRCLADQAASTPGLAAVEPTQGPPHRLPQHQQCPCLPPSTAAQPRRNHDPVAADHRPVTALSQASSAVSRPRERQFSHRAAPCTAVRIVVQFVQPLCSFVQPIRAVLACRRPIQLHDTTNRSRFRP